MLLALPIRDLPNILCATGVKRRSALGDLTIMAGLQALLLAR